MRPTPFLLLVAATVLAQDQAAINATSPAAPTLTASAGASASAPATITTAAAAEVQPTQQVDQQYIDDIMGQGKALWAFVPVSIVGTIASLLPFLRNFDRGIQNDY
ncbi:hypothetical protein HDU98_000303 [Podochytrium sp. JEL0797]|nr:hypothetical protein HDU98_000303 [Podochytrium sp. JEL0797]